jgi:AbrB family looped-hinge helix DNA binding protein
VTTSVSSKGQIVLPAELRKQDKIRPGQKFTVERLREGAYRITREKKSTTRKGWAKLWMSCPVKGPFVELKSPSTETLWHS